jgi:hypothetical protein
MRPISFCKTAYDCAEALREMNELDVQCGRHLILADHIHDLTRWITVSERMPTEADCTKIKYAQHLNVLAMDVFGDVRVTNYSLVTESHGYKAWQRITPPEGV